MHGLSRYDSLKSALFVLLWPGCFFQILSLIWDSWLLSPASRHSFPILPGVFMSKSRQPGCSHESLPFSLHLLVRNIANVKTALTVFCSLTVAAGLSGSGCLWLILARMMWDPLSILYPTRVVSCVGCAVQWVLGWRGLPVGLDLG